MKKLTEAQKQKIDDKFSTFQKWAGRLGAIATVIGVVTAGGAWIINQVNDNIATKLENQLPLKHSPCLILYLRLLTFLIFIP